MICLMLTYHVLLLQVKYHEEFEKNIKGTKVSVTDEPELERYRLLTVDSPICKIWSILVFSWHPKCLCLQFLCLDVLL